MDLISTLGGLKDVHFESLVVNWDVWDDWVAVGMVYSTVVGQKRANHTTGIHTG